jgi:hypothetical protein
LSCCTIMVKHRLDNAATYSIGMGAARLFSPLM